MMPGKHGENVYSFDEDTVIMGYILNSVNLICLFKMSLIINLHMKPSSIE